MSLRSLIQQTWRPVTQSIWFEGPKFLYENESSWPENSHFSIPSELKRAAQVCTAVELSTSFEFITRNSSFPKLIRILGYVYRFLNQTNSRERSVSLTAREL